MIKKAKSWFVGENSIWGKTFGSVEKGWKYFWKNYEIRPKKPQPDDFLLPIVGLGLVFIIATKWKPR